MQKVRVIAKTCGAWWNGDVFETSDGHAASLVAEGKVEYLEKVEQRVLDPHAENKAIVLDTETKLEGLEWPDWLWKSPRQSLYEAGVTPQNVTEYSVDDLKAIYRIGESTAIKLLDWAQNNHGS